MFAGKSLFNHTSLENTAIYGIFSVKKQACLACLNYRSSMYYSALDLRGFNASW